MSAVTKPEPGDDEEPGSDPPGDTPDRDRAMKKERTPQATIWQRATYRWAAITTVMGILLILYTQHPYYKSGQFAPWRPFYTTAFVAWILLGLFYCKATITRFHEKRFMMRDGGLHLIMLAKIAGEFIPRQSAWLLISSAVAYGISRFILGAPDPTVHPFTLIGAAAGALGIVLVIASLLRPGKHQKRFWRAVKNPRIRTTLLAICVKGFFTPLMTGFFVGHSVNIADAWLRHRHVPVLHFVIPPNTSLPGQVSLWFTQLMARLPDFVPSARDINGLFAPSTWTRDDWSWGFDVGYNIVFFIDCGWALIGYSSESRWLGNKTRSVEPTAFGWAVCLACYPPYNNVLGTYLPLDNGVAVITDPFWLLVLRGTTVALFTIYASATVAFGFKFSNLTHRGVVSRGPYRFVRHPAYLTKCTAWWLEHIPTMTITKAIFLVGLCGVYALRAWTEERHLGKDPAYQEYKKKTPWILFPGVY